MGGIKWKSASKHDVLSFVEMRLGTVSLPYSSLLGMVVNSWCATGSKTVYCSQEQSVWWRSALGLAAGEIRGVRRAAGGWGLRVSMGGEMLGKL